MSRLLSHADDRLREGRVGGVGTRGPGERQIEIDRRIVKDRISYLKKEIARIDQRKQREVRSRQEQFTVALVGYTNSGKTTLMNRVTSAERYAADQLFATLDTKTARWDLGEGRGVLLSDTVGFVRDLPHELVAALDKLLDRDDASVGSDAASCRTRIEEHFSLPRIAREYRALYDEVG